MIRCGFDASSSRSSAPAQSSISSDSTSSRRISAERRCACVAAQRSSHGISADAALPQWEGIAQGGHRSETLDLSLGRTRPATSTPPSSRCSLAARSTALSPLATCGTSSASCPLDPSGASRNWPRPTGKDD
jgi:hypothetical protein